MSRDVCRLCLAGNVQMYSLLNAELLDIYEKVTSNQWNRDNRPDAVCYICLSQLKRCFKLREMSKQSEAIFAQFFAGGLEFTEETTPILNKRKLHKFLVTPVQEFTIGLVPKGNTNEGGITIKLEHTEIIPEEAASERNDSNKASNPSNEVIPNSSGPCPQKDVIKKGIIHQTPKETIKDNYSSHNKDINSILSISHEEIIEEETTQHSGQKAVKNSPKKTKIIKNSLNKPEISSITSSHKEIETSSNEISEPNSQSYTKSSENTNIKDNKINETEDKMNVDNSESNNNRRSICFSLRFNINSKNGHSKTLQTGKRPLPLGFFNQSQNKKLLNTPYKCEYCHKSFMFKYSLEDHIKTHGEKTYFCENCDKSFNQRSLLKLHRNSHEKPYTCEECPKKFLILKHLNDHYYRSHRNKSYTCEVCNKIFSQLGNLQQHMRTHTGDRPYYCDICDKSFKQMSNLLQHKRVHTKEKPYQCDICLKSFGQRSNLDQHRRIHDGKMPYSCDYCEKAFRQKSNLMQHISRMHSEN